MFKTSFAILSIQMCTVFVIVMIHLLLLSMYVDHSRSFNFGSNLNNDTVIKPSYKPG